MFLKFICPKCDLSFTIEDKNLLQKENICCPNCSLEYPQTEFNNLKDGIKLFISGKNASVTFNGLGTIFATFFVEVSEKHPSQ